MSLLFRELGAVREFAALKRGWVERSNRIDESTAGTEEVVPVISSDSAGGTDRQLWEELRTSDTDLRIRCDELLFSREDVGAALEAICDGKPTGRFCGGGFSASGSV